MVYGIKSHLNTYRSDSNCTLVTGLKKNLFNALEVLVPSTPAKRQELNQPRTQRDTVVGDRTCVCTAQTPWEEVLCISVIVRHLGEASCAQLLYPFSVGCIQS